MISDSPPRKLRLERMGTVAYGPMHELQKIRHADVLAGHQDDTLFLLEHLPVITAGKNTGRGHVLAAEQELGRRGVEIFDSGRGGDVTYHAPGQIVGYPIVHLVEGERDIRKYVCNLEEVLIRTAKDFGVEATRVDGMRGIWVGNDKLAAVGVRISRWTTMHGFAFNVSTDLRGFDLIVPCGLEGRGVTSLEKLLGQAPSLVDVENRLAHHCSDVLGRTLEEGSASTLPQVAEGTAVDCAELVVGVS
jgi:lipoyl(octanoyl) transferase